MLDYVLNLIKLLFCRKIIFISNTLQMLNLIEFIHAHKSFHKEFSNYIIICPYTNEEAFNKIKICHKKFIAKNNLILNYQKKTEIKTLYIVLAVKKFLNLKIDQIIIGNYFSNLSQQFIKISREVFILDDGTNLLDKKHLKLVKKTKYLFFSFFDKKFFQKNFFKENDFKFFKNKFIIKKKYSKKTILILGKPLVEGNYIKAYQYDFLIEYIKKKFKNKNFYYFPHPKENTYRLKKKFKFLKILKSRYPCEIYVMKLKKFPKTIVTFNSSSIIALKILNKNLNIYNLFLTRNLSKKIPAWDLFSEREIAIKNYILKLSVKTKILELPGKDDT
jgi:hypothetical protein